MPEVELFAGRCVLTNCNVWSLDSRWIAFDTRSDPAGSVFDGTRIQMVNVETRDVRTVYESRNGAHCGVVTFHPTEPIVAFIHGPEFPTPEYSYGPSKRYGVMCMAETGSEAVPLAESHPIAKRVVLPPPLVEGRSVAKQPGGEIASPPRQLKTPLPPLRGDLPSTRRGVQRAPHGLRSGRHQQGHLSHAVPLDARDLSPPFTPGALRGGSHVHVWNPAGTCVSFTYEDDIAAPGLRTIGVSMPLTRLTVPKTHPRSHDGGFSFLVAKVVPNPKPGSDEIGRAVEEGWIGSHSLAFQGVVVNERGEPVPEVFVVDLPDGRIAPGDGPLQGTRTELPSPPRGVTQRRLTFGGIHGPRHWLRSSPDGSRIAFLRKDSRGVVQLFTVSPNGGESVQVTDSEHAVASAFTWHPDGKRIALIMDHSVCLVDATTGVTRRVTPRTDDAPLPEACVISPDGARIAFTRHRDGQNRLCVVGY